MYIWDNTITRESQDLNQVMPFGPTFFASFRLDLEVKSVWRFSMPERGWSIGKIARVGIKRTRVGWLRDIKPKCGGKTETPEEIHLSLSFTRLPSWERPSLTKMTPPLIIYVQGHYERPILCFHSTYPNMKLSCLFLG